MKGLLLVFVTIFFSACSFDNKTGIWKDGSNIPVENKNSKSISKNLPSTRYEELFSKNQTFNKEVELLEASNIEIDEALRIANWVEQYGIPTNNISNFFYGGNNTLLSKSSKLTRSLSDKKSFNKKILFYKNNLISYDHKGRIFIYSLDLNKKVFEYNFYKKNFKNFSKEINFLINEDVLYISDNLGYLYALNLDTKSIIWAKNYGIPFRSNMKFANKEIFLANQDNVIYAIDSVTGNKKWQFSTSVTFLKSDFENNLALDLINKNVIFLNTSGELYSINFESQKVNWVLNFKNPSLVGDTELFLSQPLIIKNNDLIISTEKSLLNYNITAGSRNWIFLSEPIFKPIITSNFTYAILKNNLLICLNNKSGKIIWSKNIFNKVEYKKIQNKFGIIKDFKIVNGKINIYFENGYLLTFSPRDGEYSSLTRISKKGINSKIIFLDDKMLFIDNSNKLLKFN